VPGSQQGKALARFLARPVVDLLPGFRAAQIVPPRAAKHRLAIAVARFPRRQHAARIGAAPSGAFPDLFDDLFEDFKCGLAYSPGRNLGRTPRLAGKRVKPFYAESRALWLTDPDHTPICEHLPEMRLDYVHDRGALCAPIPWAGDDGTLWASSPHLSAPDAANAGICTRKAK
jgi:hypothetical protein